MAEPTTSSSSETQGVAGPTTDGLVEELEDNISTLNTSISPLGISPFKKQTATVKTICQGKSEASWNCHQAETTSHECRSDTSSDKTGESEIVQ